MAGMILQLDDCPIDQWESKFITPPLPSPYLFNIKASTLKPNKEKTGTVLELELEIAATVEGKQYVGKSVAMYFTLANTHSPKAVEFGRQQLAKVVVAVGLSTSQFNTDDLVGLSFVSALTKQAESDFINFARILTPQGMEAIDRFGNVKEPVFEKEPELGVKLAALREQLGGQGATAQNHAPAMPTMPTQPQQPTGFPPAQSAPQTAQAEAQQQGGFPPPPANNGGGFPPPPAGNAAPAMGGFPPTPPAASAAPSGFPPQPAQTATAPSGFPPFVPQG